MSRTWSSLPFRFLLAFASAAVFSTAAGAVTVQISPADTTVTYGDTFTLRVMVDAVPDLKAYELIYHYAAGLQYLGATAGDILTGSGQPYAVQNVPDVVAPADTAWTDCAQLITSTSGPGVMLYMTFKGIAYGTSAVSCLNVDLRDSYNNVTIPACAGGQVHVFGPTPTRRATWGRLKSIYR